MTIAEQIELILSERKKKSEMLKTRKEELMKIKLVLRNTNAELGALARNIADDELRKQYIAVIKGLETTDAENEMDRLIRRVNNGIKRFDREQLSIATVGKERQGKSKFLQSVGALDNNIIPAYDATSCTGATSIIWNTPTMAKGTVRAVITFRQPDELMEIVKPYIMELDPNYLKERKLAFEDIGDLKSSYFHPKEGDERQASAMEHLMSIVDHFDEIQHLFGSSTITLTDPELIKTYVAQNNGLTKYKDADYEEYHNWIAVKRADIYCPFYTDVGRLRLVDTVGIGDTKYGIEEMMLHTVDQECDAAIVVTKPISGIQQPDQALYRSLRERFELRNTSLWLFYLVNHHVGQNDKTVASFEQGVKNSRWSVADCRIVDSSNPDTVRDDFLMPMLKTLLNNMDAIDGAYLNEIDVQEKAAKKKIKALLEELPSMEVIDTNSTRGKEAYEKGKQCFNRMTAELKRLVFRWSEEKDRPNTVLWNRVQAILNHLDDIIPPAEKIQAISDNCGALTGEPFWEMILHNVRNEITDRFILIDDVLEKATRDFKNSLVGVLYEELRALAESTDPELIDQSECDMVQWLKSMMDEILGSNKQYEQIHKAFNFLYRFEFNTRAQLIQEVRRQMYIINPICKEYAKPSINFHAYNCGDAVHFYLTSRMSVIEDELRYHLSKLYTTPNQAFYAAAEEFYDRLTFASDLSGDSLISMSDVWGLFFQEYSSKLWKDDVMRYESVNALIVRYNEIISELNAFLDISDE